MKLVAAILAGAVSALKTRDGDCDWIWEECSQSEYRWACELEETPTDCGWWYWSEEDWDEYWVTCDDFDSWEECWTDEGEGGDYCDLEWYWDECWGGEWQADCDSDEGWWYWDEAVMDVYWVSVDDWWDYCADYDWTGGEGEDWTDGDGDDWCDLEWYYDECLDAEFMWGCEEECGDWYWDEDDMDVYWLSCDDWWA